MNCDIIFNVGDLSIPIRVLSESATYPTNSEILEALKSDPESSLKLFDYIENNYSTDKNIRVDIDELIKKEGVVGNTTVKDLHTTVTFPEGVNANILLLNAFDISTHNLISGRHIKSNGEELFIVLNNDIDLKKLAAFLDIRAKILDNPNLIDENSSNYADLEIIRKQLKIIDIPTMLLTFLEGKNKFRSKYFKDFTGTPRSVYVYLDTVLRLIRGYSERKVYANAFVNDISKLEIHRKLKNRYTEKAIKLEDLYNALKAHYPNLLKKLEINSKNYEDKFNSTEFDEKLFENVVKDKPLIFTLFSELIKKEPRYKARIQSINNSEIRINYENMRIERDLGIGFDEIYQFELKVQDYRGYKIYAFNYDGQEVFIYSRNYLTEQTKIDDFYDTIDAAKLKIDEVEVSNTLYNNSFLKFKFRDKIKMNDEEIYDPSKYIYRITLSALNYEVGQIIDSIDIPIDPHTKFYDTIEAGLAKRSNTANLLDVYNIIDAWNIENKYKNEITSLINNAEKAVVFLYKINELLKDDRTNGEELLNIAKDIDKRKKISYYIQSFTENKNGTTYTLVPVDSKIKTKYRKGDKSAPIKSLLMEMQDIMERKTGVLLNLLTSQQIAEKFSIDLIDPNTAKAFIYNGEIYINTTIASGQDLLHEYSHIILGVLKANKDSRKHYEELMMRVYELSSEKERLAIQEKYPYLTEVDQMEELFVDKFADYVLRLRTSEKFDQISDLFKLNEKFLKEGTKTIFDLLGDEDLPTVYTSNINSLMSKFCSDIATKLNEGTGLELELIQDTRKKVRWINTQIENGEIIKEGCL